MIQGVDLAQRCKESSTACQENMQTQALSGHPGHSCNIYLCPCELVLVNSSPMLWCLYKRSVRLQESPWLTVECPHLCVTPSERSHVVHMLIMHASAGHKTFSDLWLPRAFHTNATRKLAKLKASLPSRLTPDFHKHIFYFGNNSALIAMLPVYITSVLLLACLALPLF